MLRENVPEELEDHPPTDASVYTVLQDTDLSTRKELNDETILADRTIQRALNRLVEANLVTKQKATDNPEKYVYAIAGQSGQRE